MTLWVSGSVSSSMEHALEVSKILVLIYYFQKWLFFYKSSNYILNYSCRYKFAAHKRQNGRGSSGRPRWSGDFGGQAPRMFHEFGRARGQKESTMDGRRDGLLHHRFLPIQTSRPEAPRWANQSFCLFGLYAFCSKNRSELKAAALRVRSGMFRDLLMFWMQWVVRARGWASPGLGAATRSR